MGRSLRIAMLVVLVHSVPASRARGDFSRRCEDRPLDASERAAADRVLSAFRTALPTAPAGWTVREDGERVSAIACDRPGKTWSPDAKLLAEPVSVHIYRTYARSEAPPPSTAEAAPVPVQPAREPAVDTTRRKELEAQLADLQRSRKDVQRAYQDARRTGDGAAQGAARRRDQEIALAMRPIQEELSKLRRTEAEARAAHLDAVTATAVAQDRAAAERRRDARVSITANLKWVRVQRAEALDGSGADVALRHSDGVLLLVGPWAFARGDTGAGATLDEAAPRSRIQTVAVEISGNAATAEALRGKVALATLRRLVRD